MRCGGGVIDSICGHTGGGFIDTARRARGLHERDGPTPMSRHMLVYIPVWACVRSGAWSRLLGARCLPLRHAGAPAPCDVRAHKPNHGPAHGPRHPSAKSRAINTYVYQGRGPVESGCGSGSAPTARPGVVGGGGDLSPEHLRSEICDQVPSNL